MTPNRSKLSRRTFLALTGGIVGGIALMPRVSFADGTPTPTITPTDSPLPPLPAAGPIDLKAAGGMDALVAAAKKEGALNVIALPDDWADYGESKKIFFDRYGLTKSDLSPQESSGFEIAAIKSNAGNSGPQNPDVVDVGFKWGQQSKALFQPYKVATWDTIPDSLKDKDGYYLGDYYGTMSFEVNADIVKNIPQDWSDLLKPEYKGMVALGGDPTAASEAVHGIWAAAIGNGGSLDDPMPGINFFKQLVQAGNFNPTIAQAGLVQKGETPIALRWDFNALSDRDAATAKNTANIQVLYPKSGSIAGVYLQAINAYAPHPMASRLWQEFLYSDEGQLLWLKGYAKPVRFDDLMTRKVIPDDLLAKLPKSTGTVGIPSYDQENKATPIIVNGWKTVVAPVIPK